MGNDSNWTLPLRRCRFHPRAARVRAFFLFLKALEPLVPRTGERLHSLLNEGFRDAALIFRRESSDVRAELANRALMGAAGGTNVLQSFRDLEGRDEAFWLRVLKSHAISVEGWERLVRGTSKASCASVARASLRPSFSS